MPENTDRYAEYKERQKRLSEMINRAEKLLRSLDADPQKIKLLAELDQRVSDDSFKIMVVGEFNSGKSTFINSMLGEAVLPTAIVRCTAIINEIKWSEKKKAVIHFSETIPADMPMDGIPEEIKKHMASHGFKNVPPIEIPYDEISDYVVIPRDVSRQNMEFESPYKKLELFWPLPALKNGVMIIDSPGLNDRQTKTVITSDYLKMTDAVIFLFSVHQAFTDTEMSFIESRIGPQGFDKPYFVINKIDQVSSEDLEMVREDAEQRLEGLTSNGGIWYVSALKALEARKNFDAEGYAASGMEGFSEELRDYLTCKRGGAKLSQPIKQFSRILEDVLLKDISDQRAMLGKDLEALEREYESEKPRLDKLRSQRDRIYDGFINRINIEISDIEALLVNFYDDIANSIPGWVNEYKPKTKLKTVSGAQQKQDQMNAVISELSGMVMDKIDEKHEHWRKTLFEPLIQDKLRVIFMSAEGALNDVFSEIDSINKGFTGRFANAKPRSAWDRIAGDTGQMPTAGTEISYAGITGGVGKGIAASVAVEIGAFAALGLLGLANPFIIAALLGGGVAANIFAGGNMQMNALKKQFTDDLVGKIRASSAERTAESVTKIYNKFTQIANTANASIDVEINDTQKRVTDIIRQLRKGEESTEKKRNALADAENEIVILMGKLSVLLAELAKLRIDSDR